MSQKSSQDRSQKQQFWIIWSIVFLGFLGISIPYLIFPALFLNANYCIVPAGWSESSHALLLGLTLAAYPLGQFIGSPILGALSDDYGRKQLLSLSLLITAICNLLTGFALEGQMLSLLIASRFAAGLMEGNIAIARAMVADLKTISKHAAFGKINAAASIAYLIGPLLGGIMTDSSLWKRLTISTPFYFICLLFFGLSILCSVVLEKRPRPLLTKALTIWQRVNIIKRLGVLFANRRLRFLMIASTAFTLAIDIFYEFGPVYLTAKWMLEPVQLTIYNSLLCLTLVAGNGWLASYCSSRVSSRLAILSCTGILALFLIGMVLTDSPYVMMALFSLSGLVIGLGVTSLTVKISDSVSDDIQGEVMGSQVSLRVLGDAIICLLGGALLLISSKLILVAAAAMSLAAMIYYALRD